MFTCLDLELSQSKVIKWAVIVRNDSFNVNGNFGIITGEVTWNLVSWLFEVKVETTINKLNSLKRIWLKYLLSHKFTSIILTRFKWKVYKTTNNLKVEENKIVKVT